MIRGEHKKLTNGHVKASSKKPMQKFRSITKSQNQAESYHDDDVSSHNSAPEDSSTSTSPNLVSDAGFNDIAHVLSSIIILNIERRRKR